MIQCPHCSVEAEENANYCSLCGEPLFSSITDNNTFVKSGRLRREERVLTDYQKLSGFQQRKVFWKISGLILISGIIFTLLIDFIGQQNITWSRYPATVSFILFINFTLNTFLHKRINLVMTLSFLASILFFILLDLYSDDSGWKLHLGIPLILSAYITVYILIVFIRKARQKGMNIIAYSLIALGILCICIEGIISVYYQSNLYFGWSLIVLVSVSLIALLLLYIHYRLKKATDLKRFFHI